MSKLSPTARTTIIDAIRNANSDRDPERLVMKYAKMALSPFSFLRGACHLFYANLPDSPSLHRAPLAWSCGDLHFENYGSYKGDNRLVYFDINDYDEAALAPATWDLLRLLTSIRCGANDLRISPAEAQNVSQSCLDAYRLALLRGKAMWVEAETSSGLIKALFDNLQLTKRHDFLNKRTLLKNGRRSLRLDGIKALPATAEQKKRVGHFMKNFAATQPEPAFFEVLDIGRRIAGTGSLGVERFAILLAGGGSPDSNYLLDLKEARPSAQAPALAQRGISQPEWPDEASRVVAVQQRMQAIDHAFLHAVKLDGLPCILRGLQATEDRVAIGEWGKKLDRLRDVVATLGQVLAWDQLRASGRSGSATADELMAFAGNDDWTSEIMASAGAMSDLNRQQWQVFVDARTSGQLA